jgi:hypothetical protein
MGMGMTTTAMVSSMGVVWGSGRLKKKSKCGRGTMCRLGREGVGASTKTVRYIHRLTNESTTTYIHPLTDECTGLSLSVQATFLGAGTEEYSPVKFFTTEEYKVGEECTLFSCSAKVLLAWLLRLKLVNGS